MQPACWPTSHTWQHHCLLADLPLGFMSNCLGTADKVGYTMHAAQEPCSKTSRLSTMDVATSQQEARWRQRKGSKQDLSSKTDSLCHVFRSVLLCLLGRQAIHHNCSMPVDVLYDAVLNPATVRPWPRILQCTQTHHTKVCNITLHSCDPIHMIAPASSVTDDADNTALSSRSLDIPESMSQLRP